MAESHSAADEHADLLDRVERLELLVAELAAARPPQPVSAQSQPATAFRGPMPAAAQRAPRASSLESALGTRVLSKVAVLLLLMSMAWFLKWAFDNRWIGPLGRVVTGLMAGAAVVLWSERFRRQQMLAFSYALKAVGSGVLYLSLWAAFQVYQLMPAGPALAAMVVVTAANGALAVSQDAELLAAFALAGGLLTPLLVSTGGNHEVFLFSYLFVFAAATVALLHFRQWNRLLLGVFPAVVAYFIAWYVLHFSAAQAEVTLAFALLLWLVFAITPFVAQRPDDAIVAILLPLSAATFGALSVYSVLADSGSRAWEPWGAIAFAAVYLAAAHLRRAGIAATTHLSLALVFLAVAVTLKATGRAVSVGWLVEAVALLWLAARYSGGTTAENIRAAAIYRWLACALLVLGTAGALLAPYISGHGTPFFNRNFALVLGDLLALAAAIYFSRSFPMTGLLRRPSIAATSLVLLNLVLLIGMGREISAVCERGLGGAALTAATEQAHFLISGWMMLQAAVLIALGFARRVPLARWLGLLLLTATVVKAFAYDMLSLSTGYRIVSYLGLGVLLLCVSFAYQKDWLGLRSAADDGAR